MSQPVCDLCGEPMPAGEEMFKFHGFSGPCPKPPSPREDHLVCKLCGRTKVARSYWCPACEREREATAEDERFAANMKANAEVQEAMFNPAVQVRFRAGILACREIMARFVEQGGDTATAASIRANWFPSLGPDPGPPRQLHWDELADEQPSGRIEHKAMDPSVEALPFAWAFIEGNHKAVEPKIYGRDEPVDADIPRDSDLCPPV